MKVILFFLVIIAAVILWVWSVASIPDKKTFWKYSLIHTILFGTYSYFWNNYFKVVTNHDEYGLGQIFGYLVILVCHSFIGFIVIKLRFNRLKRNS